MRRRQAAGLAGVWAAAPGAARAVVAAASEAGSDGVAIGRGSTSALADSPPPGHIGVDALTITLDEQPLAAQIAE